ncbi:MAG: p-hydroxycinnamoyl-CoA synthetase, partial [Myxococcota bacterium]
VGRAFLVLRSSVDADEVRAWLEPQLASYQRPRNYVVLDALPTTGAGKVDKAGLAALQGEGGPTNKAPA